MAETERAGYIFKVKEGIGGIPWIMLEPMDKDISILDKGFLGMDLAPNITYQQAEEIARFLNENIKSVSFTAL